MQPSTQSRPEFYFGGGATLSRPEYLSTSATHGVPRSCFVCDALACCPCALVPGVQSALGAGDASGSGTRCASLAGALDQSAERQVASSERGAVLERARASSGSGWDCPGRDHLVVRAVIVRAEEEGSSEQQACCSCQAAWASTFGLREGASASRPDLRGGEAFGDAPLWRREAVPRPLEGLLQQARLVGANGDE